VSDLTQKSKLLSYVLRHAPQEYGLTLDPHGWIEVADLLAAFAARGTRIDRETLRAIVAEDDKQRYAFSEGERRIRAHQGHSVAVALEYAEERPPAELFHGTIARFLPSIRAQGLLRGARHHVHLSPMRELAEQVGARRGRALVLVVRALELYLSGMRFFRTPNGVWLVEHVPARFLVLPPEAQ